MNVSFQALAPTKSIVAWSTPNVTAGMIAAYEITICKVTAISNCKFILDNIMTAQYFFDMYSRCEVPPKLTRWRLQNAIHPYIIKYVFGVLGWNPKTFRKISWGTWIFSSKWWRSLFLTRDTFLFWCCLFVFSSTYLFIHWKAIFLNSNHSAQLHRVKSGSLRLGLVRLLLSPPNSARWLIPGTATYAGEPPRVLYSLSLKHLYSTITCRRSVNEKLVLIIPLMPSHSIYLFFIFHYMGST